MLLQHTVLPLVYSIGAKGKIEKGSVIFADAHHNTLPFSMVKMHHDVKALGGKRIYMRCLDFQNTPLPKLFLWLIRFMWLYSRAEYVFICDNFLPVSSCRKRAGTTVVQLWHSGGLFKRSGYDQRFSVPEYYKGNVFANYDLLTVSAQCCVPVFTRMMCQPQGVVKATGLSRTDIYFNQKFKDKCSKDFFEKYPQAKGKKIVLYAPTFRGSADDPQLVGKQDIEEVFEKEDGYFLVKKLHPHYENKHPDEVSCDIPSERLLPVADLLITDYSSVLFDWMLFEKPFVIFAPDIDEYVKNVGFYADIYKFPTTVAKNKGELEEAVTCELSLRQRDELAAFRAYHMGACDGRATKRILKQIELI